MPIDQQPHGIGSYIKKINQEYQNEYNTNQKIFDMGPSDTTVNIQNTTVKGHQLAAEMEKDVSANATQLKGFDFIENGTRMIATSEANGTYEEFTPNESYSVHSLSHVASYSYSQLATFGLCAGKTGSNYLKVLHSSGGSAKVTEHETSTASDITTLVNVTTHDFGTSHGLNQATAIRFNSDGSNLYVVDYGKLHTFALSTNHTLQYGFDSSSTYDLDALYGTGTIRGFDFSKSGDILYVLDTYDRLHKLNLSTPYDVSTESRETTYDVATNTPGPTFVNPNNYNLIVVKDNGSIATLSELALKPQL